MLKHQVRAVRETMIDTTSHVPCSQTNKFAKQFLRVLSIWSVLGIADGSMSFQLACVWNGMSPKPWAGGTGVKSPMVLSNTMWFCFHVWQLVAYMVPTRWNRSRARTWGQQADAEVGMEPSTEPQSSRYEVKFRDLWVLRFPGVFADATFQSWRDAGLALFQMPSKRFDEKTILWWMQKGWTDFLRWFICLWITLVVLLTSDTYPDEGKLWLRWQTLQMMKGHRASGSTNNRWWTTLDQAFQGYQVGMSMFGHLRRPQQAAGSDDEEQVESQRSTDSTGTVNRQCQRFQTLKLWMEDQPWSQKMSDIIATFATWCERRHEVSDTENYGMNNRLRWWPRERRDSKRRQLVNENRVVRNVQSQQASKLTWSCWTGIFFSESEFADAWQELTRSLAG